MATKENLQSVKEFNLSKSELILANDAIVEAFSIALELRNGEAKGHTLRATELTLSLAKALGVGDLELVHIRRGALLHDIGNLAVPETILHKQGELTADEWVTIHMHPFYAYEMLEPIIFLRPALDIPYYHHEKWGGTGYPRGLKGEQIPLAARIFAIADTWDALTSIRPYRPMWPEVKALGYLREQSGLHFDPLIVNLALESRILPVH